MVKILWGCWSSFRLPWPRGPGSGSQGILPLHPTFLARKVCCDKTWHRRLCAEEDDVDDWSSEQHVAMLRLVVGEAARGGPIVRTLGHGQPEFATDRPASGFTATYL